MRDDNGNSFKDKLERLYYDYKNATNTQFYAFADCFDIHQYFEDMLTVAAINLQLQVGMENRKRCFYSSDFDSDKTKILNQLVNTPGNKSSTLPVQAKAGRQRRTILIAVIALMLVAAIAMIALVIQRSNGLFTASSTDEKNSR